MIKLTVAALSAGLALASPVLAADPAAGEKSFNKCKACHSVIAADGTAIVKGGKTGPNLFGVIGRPVGSVAEFNYGGGLPLVGAKGVAWDEAQVTAYLADPNAWVKGQLAGTPDEGSARSNMNFKIPKADEAANIAAWLATQK